MSFCRNCGYDVGDAKFCPSCGTSTSGTETAADTAATTTTATVGGGFSEYYPELSLYHSRATKILVFGILSIIFCMGIGLIFEIITIILSAKIKNVFPHGDKLTNPIEIAMYNTASSRHRVGSILSAIALLITAVLLYILFFVTVIL